MLKVVMKCYSHFADLRNNVHLLVLAVRDSDGMNKPQIAMLRDHRRYYCQSDKNGLKRMPRRIAD
jgi:hypothetical protein